MSTDKNFKSFCQVNQLIILKIFIYDSWAVENNCFNPEYMLHTETWDGRASFIFLVSI